MYQFCRFNTNLVKAEGFSFDRAAFFRFIQSLLGLLLSFFAVHSLIKIMFLLVSGATSSDVIPIVAI